ncbi:hypothetical protein BDY19DRAFT_360065 [Irpex rosettiformis]|uniref:Uncharacterized protein n=1 Tax=Irpex rosettiformis TaxID=378272 RepID=A0ACB8TWK7_9APHY|nr:hypothetical protein BDY19DRAFT_360065 [Irpex rosettiformis]
MADVQYIQDTNSFGEPTLLLGDASDLLLEDSAAKAMDTRSQLGGSEFTSNGLLGDASFVEEEDVTMMDAVPEDSESTRMMGGESEGFGEATLLNDDLMSNGLLDGPEAGPSTFTSTGTSQSQEDEFPEIRDLLRTYAPKRSETSVVGVHQEEAEEVWFVYNKNRHASEDG